MRAGQAPQGPHDDPRPGRQGRRRPRRPTVQARGAQRALGRDITYLRTWEGWLYLAAVQDAFSRRIVGWAMADHMRSELVVDALQMALARRKPGPGLVHHSDQGSQFVSLAFGQRARDAGIAVSMGSRGDCYDNAVAESFFATLKKELVRRRTWPTRRELTGELFDYIEAFYNPTRRHSTLGYLSPAQFELRASRSDIKT
ncbi:MAG: IS3 family transposase, partial [Solirubrobacteraceae bacterium]